MNHTASSYRPEIDGLRAISVIAVILFHSDIGNFSRGFIGVDIFFVISGYLITRLIAEQLQQGTFRFADFYERRARRILPALLFVLLVLFCAHRLPKTIGQSHSAPDNRD